MNLPRFTAEHSRAAEAGQYYGRDSGFPQSGTIRPALPFSAWEPWLFYEHCIVVDPVNGRVHCDRRCIPATSLLG